MGNITGTQYYDFNPFEVTHTASVQMIPKTISLFAHHQLHFPPRFSSQSPYHFSTVQETLHLTFFEAAQLQSII